ncbi:MAG: hypothetical protein IPL46_25770 [Saprospiraceae bacterium]|nr:hypothetical protein [Saprospiraceae bacterium]
MPKITNQIDLSSARKTYCLSLKSLIGHDDGNSNWLRKFSLSLFRTIAAPLFLLIGFVFTPIEIWSQCDPATIDRCDVGKNSIVQAAYHSQIVKTFNGYSITGQKLASDGTSSQLNLTPYLVHLIHCRQMYFRYGVRLRKNPGSILGSNGVIYAVGAENAVISTNVTSSTSWGATTLNLPAGVTVCDVAKWEGTGNVENIDNGFLAFSTNSGVLYVTGQDASIVQTGAASGTFTQVTMPLGITVVDFAVGYRTLLVLGTDGNLYASGDRTFLGNNTASSSISVLTLLVTQPPVSAGGILRIEAGESSYYALDSDGTIHVLGFNQDGSLGVNSTAEQRSWNKVGNGCPGGVLTNVVSISTMGTNNNDRSNASAILTDGTLRSWGENDNNSITSGNTSPILCPIIPAGSGANILSVSNGGHISPYVSNNLQICNIGHNANGGFGDGTTNDRSSYSCEPIPGNPPVCVTLADQLIMSCSGMALNFSLNNLIAGSGDLYAYTVTSSSPGNVPPGPNRITPSNANITDTYVNATGSPVTITYDVTPSPANYSQFKVIVTVNPNPTCSISNGPTSVCPNTNGYVYTATGGGTYLWSITGNGTISGSNTANPVTVNAGSTGTFNLSVTITLNGCTSNCSQMVTVGQPTINLSTLPTICRGATSFTIPYTTTTGSPNQYSISGTGIVSVTNAILPVSPIPVNLTAPASSSPINFTLTVRNSTTGCTSVNVNGSVTVLPAVNYGTVASGNQTICQGGDPSNITLSTGASGGAGTFTYQWYFQNGLVTCPTGTNTTGWTMISGETGSSYDPPSGLTGSRTYAVLVDATGSPDCGAATGLLIAAR